MIRSSSLSESFCEFFNNFDFLRHEAIRLARLQFRPGTFYSVSKPYVPFVALIGAWLVMIRTDYGWAYIFGQTISVRHLLVGILIAVAWSLMCHIFTGPQRPHTPYMRETLSALLASVLCGAAQTAVHRTWPTNHLVLPGSELACWMLGSYFFLLFCSWLFADHLIPLVTTPRISLIIGTGPQARELNRDLAGDDRYKVIGMLDDVFLGDVLEEEKYLGKLEQLSFILKNKPVELVLIALPFKSMYNTIQDVIRTCETIGVDVSYMSQMFETRLRSSVDKRRFDPSNLTIVTMHGPDFRRRIKGVLDFFLALLLLLALAPLMLIVALAVRMTSPGPIFFSQLRLGIHRHRFSMFKFRTMVVDAEARQAGLEALNEAKGPVFKIKKDPRLTPIGGFLRKASLDELPQLFNVLRGEMSLVGPRPLPLRDVDKFDQSWFLRRFSVKPGLTCLWQAGGRSNLSFDDWIELDLQYIDQWSLSMDFRILALTIPAVFRGAGAS
jgi:exopolysaccharide biosynthesis polyprenyl glycosylphosphotransferase